MKAKHIVTAFTFLSLLLVASSLIAGNFEVKLKEETYTYLLILFLAFDVLLGCILVFGKVKWIRKKHRNYDYLKTHYL
ncbi:hypothetical protein [Moheibacter sediminis]|uniref:Uncharacterized protein n=1 Tax=Moheibacter sediminis TaxID=1434700 RepID=A0A1W1YCC6_9FLAO|nr:hypothetical protein [Moheibacter sediminis]SMC33799.1 hypothetical protein SAMN06296427_101252 [Moheibacter sediminis]